MLQIELLHLGGVDLFGQTSPAVMACRRYGDPPMQGWPSVDDLLERLTAARGR